MNNHLEFYIRPDPGRKTSQFISGDVLFLLTRKASIFQLNIVTVQIFFGLSKKGRFGLKLETSEDGIRVDKIW